VLLRLATLAARQDFIDTLSILLLKLDPAKTAAGRKFSL
jgi:hypothetical protein